MSKYQYPIDGGMGKTWRITSKMGWRIHPVKKTRKHHNGTDIGGLVKDPIYIEAFADGKVLKAQVSTAAGGGFGHYVVLQHKIDGEYYTSLYAHLAAGSMQVKAGQKVKVGQVLGKMGSTGMSTGRHLHWEIWKGKTHGWSADGRGFVEPVSFVKALIAAERAKGFANVAASDDDPVEKTQPVHEKPKPAPKPVAKAPAKPSVAKKPAPKAKQLPKSHKVVSGDTLAKIARKYGTTVARLAQLNSIKNVNLIRVGQVIKLS
jgi:murein DD-endopeptidase MepM/ murein hydrolase activator NlpD